MTKIEAAQHTTLLQKFSERFAVMALASLPPDYEGKKRVITSAIKAAITSPESLVLSENSVALELREAIEALGILPSDAGHGYCFCFNRENRDPSQPEEWHTGECRDVRAALQKAFRDTQ